ncbi:MAG: DUF2029 domain-containing protein [Lentisphaeria bacterium]|nr:DUF2029 domain-containing protein [Lentisphaeria bacterium]
MPGKESLMNLFMRYERLAGRIIQVILGLFVLLRLKMALKTASFIDTRFFVETADFIRRGVSPYHSKEFLAIFPAPPLQSPSVSLLSMPLCILSKNIQNAIFFGGGIIAFAVFVVMVFHYYGYHWRDYVKPQWGNLPIWVTMALIGVSSPFLMMLRHGQNASISSLLLFAVIFYPIRDNGINNLLLGLAAAMKYSLLTLQVPVLLLQKRWKMGVVAFVLFALMVLSVGLWLDGPISALLEYVRMVMEDTHDGSNSYAKASGFSMINIGFIKFDIINKLMLLTTAGMYCLALWRIKCRHGQGGWFPMHLGSASWGLFTIITMMVSYHRVYDGVLFMPFLGVIFLEEWQALCKHEQTCRLMSILKTACLLMLLLFWAIPQSLVFSVESWIGKHIPMGEKIFYYTKFEHNTMMFPLVNLVVITMFCLFYWIFWERTAAQKGKE